MFSDHLSYDQRAGNLWHCHQEMSSQTNLLLYFLNMSVFISIQQKLYEKCLHHLLLVLFTTLKINCWTDKTVVESFSTKNFPRVNISMELIWNLNKILTYNFHLSHMTHTTRFQIFLSLYQEYQKYREYLRQVAWLGKFEKFWFSAN